MNKIKVFYDGLELIPAPIINIKKEYIYANDNIIGYTYNIDINGYASSVNEQNNTSNIINTINAIDNIHFILHKNGKNLTITCDNNEIFRAEGGQLRSFNVEESDNKWIQYAKYSASLEFSNVVYPGGITSTINSDTISTDAFDYLIRLTSYNDSWDFKASEEEIYSFYTVPGAASEDYSRFNVTYTISATGKHYYDSSGNLIPAWLAAKNFVQQKLYHQIFTFRNASPLSFYFLPNTSYNSNESNAPSLNNALSSSYTGATLYPLLSNSIIANFSIFNELINCSTSESDGTFTATYSCVCKKVNQSWMPYSIHTFDVSYDKTRNFKEINNTISVNGTITGMLQTNILGSTIDGSVLVLPNNGSFIGSDIPGDYGTKYFNALRDFNMYIADATHTDLQPAYKIALNATYGTLFSLTDLGTSCINLTTLVDPQSFSINHNYAAGSIEYSVEYNTNRACAMARGFETLTIIEEDSVPIIAEFVIPGREDGPILQFLNTNSNKKISIEFKGVTKKGCIVGTPFNVDFQGMGLCQTDGYVNIPDVVKKAFFQTELAAQAQFRSALITESNTINYSPVTGDYTAAKKYIVCPPEA